MMRFYNYIFAAGYENMIRNGEDFIPWCVPLGEVCNMGVFTELSACFC